MFERNSNTKSPNNKFDFLVELEETIKICRDFYAGYNNIVNLDYLFKLHLETDKAYQLRKNLTPFSNYYASIINNVSSIVTKKEPISENLQNIKEFNTFDVDNKNNTLTNYIKKTCEESLVAGAEFVAVFKRNEKIFFKEL